MSANNLIVYVENMYVDAAAAAFFALVNPEYILLAGMRGVDFGDRLTCSVQEKWDTIILIGTYWQHNMKQFYDNANNICIYSYGTEIIVPEDQKCQVEVIRNTPENIINPLDFAINYCKLHNMQSVRLINISINVNRELFDIIRQRSLNTNTIGTQSFFTGFCNSFETNNYVENYLKLFTKEVDYLTVCKHGQVILDSQLRLAAEMSKNGGIVNLPDGRNARITNAPILTNLTHQALAEAKENDNEKCPVSITCRLVFNGTKVKMAYSVRTYDGSDARVLVGENGGGTEFAAGGDVEFNMPLPF